MNSTDAASVMSSVSGSLVSRMSAEQIHVVIAVSITVLALICAALVSVPIFYGNFFGQEDPSMLYALGHYDFRAGDVEDWMWEKASTRLGYWTISVPLRTSRKALFFMVAR